MIREDVARFPFDLTSNFPLSSGRERVHSASEDFITSSARSRPDQRTRNQQNGNARGGSDYVSVMKHVGLLLVDCRRGFELCVVIRADVEQTVRTSFSAAAEKEDTIKPMVPNLSSPW